VVFLLARARQYGGFKRAFPSWSLGTRGEGEEAEQVKASVPKLELGNEGRGDEAGQVKASVPKLELGNEGEGRRTREKPGIWTLEIGPCP